MQHDHKHYYRPRKHVSWWKTPFGIVSIVFLGLAGYFLIKEHSAHIGDNWIWLVLLLCPLMHVFMHGGHGGHGHHHNSDDDDNDRRT